jgi:Mrp family chromosome partitioning ATPase
MAAAVADMQVTSFAPAKRFEPAGPPALPVAAAVAAAAAGPAAAPVLGGQLTSAIAVEAAQNGGRTPVWVSVHRQPNERDGRLILVREPDSARAAAFRVLRHRLAERGDPKTIVVSSPAPGEGKTTCALNLALALGECGRARVLLIEANLRTPQLAHMLGFLPPECFVEQLARHRDRPLEPWSVVEVFTPFLHVAAIRPQLTPRPLLDGAAITIAIERLKLAGYHYIVIDTPPVLGGADVNLIEGAADGVLMTAWSGRSCARGLRRAIEQVQAEKVLGVALLDGRA